MNEFYLVNCAHYNKIKQLFKKPHKKKEVLVDGFKESESSFF